MHRRNKTDGNDIKYKNLKQTLSGTTGNVQTCVYT